MEENILVLTEMIRKKAKEPLLGLTDENTLETGISENSTAKEFIQLLKEKLNLENGEKESE